MIKYAKTNPRLYEEMVALGYSDKSFPVWWFSPANAEGKGAQRSSESSPSLNEQAKAKIAGSSSQEEAFDPTPPDKPVTREPGSRPQLSAPASSSQLQPAPASSGFSDEARAHDGR